MIELYEVDCKTVLIESSEELNMLLSSGHALRRGSENPTYPFIAFIVDTEISIQKDPQKTIKDIQSEINTLQKFVDRWKLISETKR